MLGKSCTWQRPPPGRRARVGQARKPMTAAMATRPDVALGASRASTNLTPEGFNVREPMVRCCHQLHSPSPSPCFDTR